MNDEKIIDVEPVVEQPETETIKPETKSNPVLVGGVFAQVYMQDEKQVINYYSISETLDGEKHPWTKDFMFAYIIDPIQVNDIIENLQSIEKKEIEDDQKQNEAMDLLSKYITDVDFGKVSEEYSIPHCGKNKLLFPIKINPIPIVMNVYLLPVYIDNPIASFAHTFDINLTLSK